MHKGRHYEEEVSIYVAGLQLTWPYLLEFVQHIASIALIILQEFHRADEPSTLTDIDAQHRGHQAGRQCKRHLAQRA